jgi:hypothetical protein
LEVWFKVDNELEVTLGYVGRSCQKKKKHTIQPIRPKQSKINEQTNKQNPLDLMAGDTM